MRIFVTGNLGYIGSILTEELLQKGYEVVGYDIGYYRDCALAPLPQPTRQIIKDIREVEAEDLENIEFYPLEKAQQMQSKKYFVQAEGQKLPFRKDAKFDFIFMRASLNDSEGISERIEEAVAYLQNGGELRIAPVWQRGPNIKELRKAADKLNKDSFSVEWKKGIVKRENVKEKALLLIIKKKHQS